MLTFKPNGPGLTACCSTGNFLRISDKWYQNLVPEPYSVLPQGGWEVGVGGGRGEGGSVLVVEDVT